MILLNNRDEDDCQSCSKKKKIQNKIYCEDNNIDLTDARDSNYDTSLLDSLVKEKKDLSKKTNTVIQEIFLQTPIDKPNNNLEYSNYKNHNDDNIFNQEVLQESSITPKNEKVNISEMSCDSQCSSKKQMNFTEISTSNYNHRSSKSSLISDYDNQFNQTKDDNIVEESSKTKQNFCERRCSSSQSNDSFESDSQYPVMENNNNYYHDRNHETEDKEINYDKLIFENGTLVITETDKFSQQNTKIINSNIYNEFMGMKINGIDKIENNFITGKDNENNLNSNAEIEKGHSTKPSPSQTISALVAGSVKSLKASLQPMFVAISKKLRIK